MKVIELRLAIFLLATGLALASAWVATSAEETGVSGESVADATQEIPPEKTVIVWNDKLGVVTFPHEQHSLQEGVECTECHHTLPKVEVVKVCAECHKDEPTAVEGFEEIAVKWEDAYHTRCTECHLHRIRELGLEAGPVKCLTCHVPGG